MYHIYIERDRHSTHTLIILTYIHEYVNNIYSKSLIEKVIQIVPKYIQLKVGPLILKSSSPQATVLINFLDILSDIVYTCAYENK